jgi:uncharacterized protein YdaU (DUF1376 family)
MLRNEMHYYQFNIGDFSLHTNHLTLEEEGVYRRLLDFYYDTELPIPIKTQSVIRRLRLGSYGETVALVLEEFFIKQEDGWHNLRADIEIADYHSKVETARANGKKGGRPKKNSGPKTQSVILANPNITQTKAKQELETVTNKQETGTNSSSPAKAGKRKTSLSPNFILSKKKAELALRYWSGKGRTDLDVREIFEQFTTYCKANGKTYVDWDSAWQTWYVNAVKFERGIQNGTGQQFGQKVVSKSERRDAQARAYLDENNDDGVAWPTGNEVSP